MRLTEAPFLDSFRLADKPEDVDYFRHWSNQPSQRMEIYKASEWQSSRSGAS